jgi:uncharacterized protein YkwD
MGLGLHRSRVTRIQAQTIAASPLCTTLALSHKICVGVLVDVVFVFGLITAVAQAGAGRSAAYFARLEKELVYEMNLARRDPTLYAAFLEQMKPYYVGTRFEPPNATPIKTEEGLSAVNEAIRFLRSESSAPPLSLSKGMSLGARKHVQDQGPRGGRGHEGSDGSDVEERINRYGTAGGYMGENISYSDETAREVVISLIIDDGVPSRGHRKNLFLPEYHFVGVACGEHAKYGIFCVIDYAGHYVEKSQKK